MSDYLISKECSIVGCQQGKWEDYCISLQARIAELEAENEELKKAMSKPWMGSARAAYRGEKE